MYNLDGITQEMFLEAFNRVATIKPEMGGVSYIDPNSMLSFVRKVQGELKEAPLDPTNSETTIPLVIGTNQTLAFIKDYGMAVSAPLLVKSFAETWVVGVAFGMLFEQERQAKARGADELTKMLNWKSELSDEFAASRHHILKL